MTISPSGVLPFESIFFLSPLFSYTAERGFFSPPRLSNDPDKSAYITSYYGYGVTAPFYPFNPVDRSPLFTQVINRNGKKYFPFRIIPRCPVNPYGYILSSPYSFSGDVKYRFFDSESSPLIQSLTYERHLLHPYGIVYLDERYILSHLEFISGSHFLQHFFNTTSDFVTLSLPHRYDALFSPFSYSFKLFRSVRNESTAWSDGSLTLSDYLDLPFSPPQYN